MKALSELAINPAPWSIGEGYLGKWVEDAHGIEIVDTGLKESAQCCANTNLIAAAPEMYELLRGVYNYLSIDIDMNHDAVGLVKNIKAVLAKASGETEGETK